MFEYDHLEARGNPIVPKNALFEGERFDRFRDMAAEGKKHGCLMVGQVSHPGCQVPEDIQPHPVSASDVQLQGNIMGLTFAKPRAATDDDIEGFIEGWAHASEYLEKAGWEVLSFTVPTDISLLNSSHQPPIKGRTSMVDYLKTGLA